MEGRKNEVENLLEMLEVQNIYLQKRYDGSEGTDLENSEREIFNSWIKPKFEVTFSEFQILARNVRRELRKLGINLESQPTKNSLVKWQAIQDRYKYLYNVERLRVDDVIESISKEFYLSKPRVYSILKMDLKIVSD